MSTEEAKQATEDEALDNAIAALGQGQKGTARQFLKSAIDTATAKAREAQEKAPRRLDNGPDFPQLAHQPLDSARDKQPSAITTNEQAYRDGTLSQPSVIRRNPNEDHRAAQPSATVRTHDFGGVYIGKQPSAPTADVEKLITKENALAYFKQFLNGDTGMASAEVLADVMLTVQHQARAPLVEAAKVLITEAESYIGIGFDQHEESNRLQAAIENMQSALIGTGDKKCPG